MKEYRGRRKHEQKRARKKDGNGWVETRQRGVRAAAATEHRHKVPAVVAVQRARAVLRKEVDVTRLTRRGRQERKRERSRTQRRARTGEEEAESRLRKIMRYLKTLERPEAKKGSRETQDVVDDAEVEVKEEEDE